MDIIEKLNWRYASKHMNGKLIEPEKLDVILEAIRLTPTSLGLQAMKVFVVSDPLLKEKIFNESCRQPQIKEASHVLVFAATRKVTADQVDGYIQLVADTRSIPVDSLAEYRAMFNQLIDAGEQPNFNWTSRQAYISLGVAAVAAASVGVDATPMEGFDPMKMDEILDLEKKNLGSVLVMPLGYRDEDSDYLSNASKVRKASGELFEFL